MDWKFTPSDDNKNIIEVPFYEDARADTAPYYTTTRTIDKCKQEVINALSSLGAGVQSFSEGTFQYGKLKRYGYEIRFWWRESQGLIRVAGLPIRNPTDKKIEQVKRQALLNVADWLKATYTSEVFSPGSSVLLGYLLVKPDENLTLQDYIMQQRQLPNLSETPLLVGEIVSE